MTFAESEQDGVDGAQGVAVSPDGRHVYAASPTDDAVAAFCVDLDLDGLCDPARPGLEVAPRIAAAEDEASRSTSPPPAT